MNIYWIIAVIIVIIIIATVIKLRRRKRYIEGIWCGEGGLCFGIARLRSGYLITAEKLKEPLDISLVMQMTGLDEAEGALTGADNIFGTTGKLKLHLDIMRGLLRLTNGQKTIVCYKDTRLSDTTSK